MRETVKVFLVDDHPAIREGIKTIIAQHSGDQPIEVTGEAGSMAESRRLLPDARADIILTDISLPDGNGFDLIRDLAAKPGIGRFLILSMHLSAEYVIEALQAGAVGYLTKSSASADLVHGILAAFRGEYFLDPQSLGLLCRRLGALPYSPLREADPAYASLTEREREIFAMLVAGHSAKAIAVNYHLSVKTVENHKTALMRKLGAGNLVELFAVAERIGIRKPSAS
jgi:DNA-binding NarL/FixJ family response regulator